MKNSKQIHKNAVEILNLGGAVKASDWTTGSGNFISKRPIPAGCREIYASQVETLKGFSKIAAKRVLRNSPRVQKIIVVDDVRAVRAKSIEITTVRAK